MADKQPAAAKKAASGGVFASLGPLTCAALTTATVMYPVDVIRALRMSGSTFGAFVGTHGYKGLFSQARQRTGAQRYALLLPFQTTAVNPITLSRRRGHAH